MTPDEVIHALVQFWDGEITEEELSERFGPVNYGSHGKCVDMVEHAYGDWFIYEDGYEEFRNRD